MDNPLIRSALTRQDGGLSVQLKTAREQARLSSRGLAAAADWPFAKPSKIERGLQMPTVADVETWAKVCGVDPKPLLATLDSLSVFTADFRAEPFQIQDAYATLYAAADSISLVEVSTVPGPLQTEEYATRVMSIVTGRPTPEIESSVSRRLDRSKFIDDTAKQFLFIVTESVLRFQYVPPAAMAEQLAVLTRVSQRPNVDLRVVPLDRQLDHIPQHSFAIYDGFAVVELQSGLFPFLAETNDAAMYAAWLDEWKAASVAGDEATALIDAAVERLR